MQTTTITNGENVPRSDAINLPPQWTDCDSSPDPQRCRRFHQLAKARRGHAPLPSLPPGQGVLQSATPEWDASKPCRGLGDVVAKVTNATGIDRVVKAIAPGGCGCAGRQKKLNALVPFQQPEGE